MDILQTSIVSVLFLAGALFVAVMNYGWPLAIVIIMFYVANILDRRIAIITTLMDTITVKAAEHQEQEGTQNENTSG